jgi:hypothetical protein
MNLNTGAERSLSSYLYDGLSRRDVARFVDALHAMFRRHADVATGAAGALQYSCHRAAVGRSYDVRRQHDHSARMSDSACRRVRGGSVVRRGVSSSSSSSQVSLECNVAFFCVFDNSNNIIWQRPGNDMKELFKTYFIMALEQTNLVANKSVLELLVTVSQCLAADNRCILRLQSPLDVRLAVSHTPSDSEYHLIQDAPGAEALRQAKVKRGAKRTRVWTRILPPSTHNDSVYVCTCVCVWCKNERVFER